MTIEEFKKKIAPHMKHGWVAMDECGLWYYFEYEPDACLHSWERRVHFSETVCLNTLFKIEPVKDRTRSLIEVGK